MPPEYSSLTIGGMLSLLIFTIVIMAIIGPIAVATGVFNPSMNASTPAAQYLEQLYGPSGVAPFLNTSINQNILPTTQASATTSLNLIGSLSTASGFAFIFGGMSAFYKALTSFPNFLYVIFITSFSYQGLQKMIPYDIGGLLSVVLLSYIAIVLVMKLVSIISKPAGSVENL